jgi:4a-hydroxytetrahydrobiopterin dehydratase
MSDPITDADRDALMAGGWTLSEDGTALSKTFTFANFVEAWGFMSRAAIWAEKLNHHPEWSNVYKTVEVRLTTHDTGGLSDLDAKLAQKMDALAAG